MAGNYYVFFSFENQLFVFTGSEERREVIERELSSVPHPCFKVLEVDLTTPGSREIITFLELDNLQRDESGWGLKLKMAFIFAFVMGFQAQREGKTDGLSNRELNQMLFRALSTDEEDEEEDNPFLDEKPNICLLRIIKNSWKVGYEWAQAQPKVITDQLIG